MSKEEKKELKLRGRVERDKSDTDTEDEELSKTNVHILQLLSSRQREIAHDLVDNDLIHSSSSTSSRHALELMKLHHKNAATARMLITDKRAADILQERYHVGPLLDKVVVFPLSVYEQIKKRHRSYIVDLPTRGKAITHRLHGPSLSDFYERQAIEKVLSNPASGLRHRHGHFHFDEHGPKIISRTLPILFSKTPGDTMTIIYWEPSQNLQDFVVFPATPTFAQSVSTAVKPNERVLVYAPRKFLIRFRYPEEETKKTKTKSSSTREKKRNVIDIPETLSAVKLTKEEKNRLASMALQSYLLDSSRRWSNTKADKLWSYLLPPFSSIWSRIRQDLGPGTARLNWLDSKIQIKNRHEKKRKQPETTAWERLEELLLFESDWDEELANGLYSEIPYTTRKQFKKTASAKESSYWQKLLSEVENRRHDRPQQADWLRQRLESDDFLRNTRQRLRN